MHVLESLPASGDYLVAFGKLVIGLGLVALAWWIVNVRTKTFDDHVEIVHERNVPFILVRTGMVIGQFIAMLALVSVTTKHTRVDLLWLVCGGLGIVVAFYVIRKVLDLVLRGSLQGADALRNTDMSSAILQTAFYIADGLVICGALTGSAPTVKIGVIGTGIFIMLGLSTLVLAYWLVGMLYGLRRSVKEDDNVAAAVILGSIIIGLGLILRTAIAGDMSDDATGAISDYVPGIVLFAIYAAIGIVVLVTLLPVLDKLVLTKVTIGEMVKERNWQPTIVMAAFVFGAALLVANIPIGVVADMAAVTP